VLSFPNAKINIGLNVVEKRNDGFHNIETVFYPVKLCDALEFVVSNKKELEFVNTGITIDSPVEKNIVVKAYRLLQRDFNLPVLNIQLHKIIPFGAGLGGGSADAAFMITSLNSYFNLGLDSSSMERYAAELGSDCAFFIDNKPVFAYNKGECFKSIDLDLTGYKILLIKPEIAIGTPEAYSNITVGKPEISLKERIKLPIEQWRNCIDNDFEDSVFPIYPELFSIKEKLYKIGAVYASMSGSGSCMYGIFKGEIPDTDLFGNLFVWKGEL